MSGEISGKTEGGLLEWAGVGINPWHVGLGLVGVASSMVVGQGAAGALGATLALLMLSIAIIDARTFIIPDRLNAAAAALGLINAALAGQGDLTWAAEATLRALLVSGAFLAVRAAYLRLRRRHGLGLGDVKLAAVAGAWLDWTVVPIAVELAALAALAAFIIRRLVRQPGMPRNERLPFGPFFAPVIWICWLLQSGVGRWLTGSEF